MFRLLRSRRSAAVVMAALVAVTSAGCAPSNTNNASTSGEKDVNIIVVSGPLDDPFFSAMKRGTADAAKDVTLSESSPTPATRNN